MAKFSCELDTKTKEAKFYFDGQEVVCKDFNISKYTVVDSMCDGETNNTHECMYASYTLEGDNGISTSYSIALDTKENDMIEEHNSNYSMAKAIYNICKDFFIAQKMTKTMMKKKMDKNMYMMK